MKIKSINIINGKNKWSESKDKLIHMVLDLGEFEEKPSNKIEGFYERIKEYLPSLKSHRCSEGKPGGFFKRIKEGTWMGHIIEHVALELQTLAGMDTGWGRTRGVKGQKGVYNVVFNYEDKDKGKLAAREAFNVVTDIINDRDPKIDNVVKKLKPKNLQESIRRILREEMNKEVKWLLRRLGDPEIMDDLDETVKINTSFTKACGMTEYHFFDEVMENSVHNFINHWEELYESDDFLPIDTFVYNLIHKKYKDYIIEKYQSKIARCY